MKKKLPIFALSALLLVGIASCGGNKTDSTSSAGGNESTSVVQPSTGDEPSSIIDEPSSSTDDPISQAPAITVDSVSITGEDGQISLNVLGGAKTKLKASVQGSQSGLKVNWSTSDADVATVTNGTVKFANVTEAKEVTITATSKDDATKSDSVTFNVERSPFDLSRSHATDLDYSTYFEEDGVITFGLGTDNALAFNGVYGTKYYVEATMSIDDSNDSAGYPKFGIMTGTSEDSYHTDAASGIQTMFYYVDSMDSKKASGWTTLAAVGQNDMLSDWNWGKAITSFDVSNEHKVESEAPYRMGLLRDGADYYFWAGKDDEIKCYTHGTFTQIAASEPTYAWIGGFNTAATIYDSKVLIGDEVSEMYEDPTEINVSTNSAYVYVGGTYQINVSADCINFDKNLITYTSNNPEIATVDEKGLVTTSDSVTGAAVITVKYGELTKEITINATDDKREFVVFDAKMDDAIWSDEVKANKITHKLNGSGEYIDFYGTRNNQGVYIFADIYVKAQKNGNTNGSWWENDNYECYFHGEDGKGISGQIWFSGNGDTNADKHVRLISDKDAETGLFNIKFESFISYDTIQAGATKDTILGIRWGSNPASGWRACSWMDSTTIGEFPKITVDGLVYHNDELEEHYCPTGEHNWSNWYTTVAKTCLSDGEQERYCKACGKREQEVLYADGQHTYWTKDDRSHINIISESTCSEHGQYTTSCKYCGEKLDTVYSDLPLDRSTLNMSNSNHTGTWIADEEDVYGGYWDCCGTSHKHSVVNELRKSSGGWEDRSTWTEIANGLLGEFEINAEWTIDTAFNDDSGASTLVSEGNQWRHPLVEISDGDSSHWAEGKAYGDDATFRFDWCGWNNDRNGDGKGIADIQNSGAAYFGEGEYFLDVLANVFLGGTVKLNAKRVGDDLTLTYVLIGADGTTYNYVQGLEGLHTNILDISITAEFSSFTLLKVRPVTATVAE